MTLYPDHFGADAGILRTKKLFLFDMDGTIYEEDRLFGGTLPLLASIRQHGGRYVFITNNSSRSVADYVKKVTAMGIDATADDFFTSTQATILYLQKNHPNARVYCQGTRSLLQELTDAGIDVTDRYDENIQLALVGFDTELTSEKLRTTCRVLQRDIPFLATNPDLACPVSFGFIPDCGSICQMLENATGRRPLYIGKPKPTMVDIARERFHCTREEAVVIGDRLYTDIATGLNAGVTAICVLSGEATEEDIRSGAIRPTFTLKSVKELWDIIR